MQSFLQYRRFRASVQAQLDREGAKVNKVEINGTTQDHSPSTLSDEGKQDLEKGEETAAAPVTSHSLHQSGLRAWEQQTGRSTQTQEPVEELKHEGNEVEGDDGDEDDDYELAAANRTLSRMTTQHSSRTALGNVLTGIEVRKRSTREGGDGNVFVVGFQDENDPNDPHNWSLTKRTSYTAIIAGIGCVVGFASSIDSSALLEASADFGVSEVAESLATGLFLVGFGLGAMYAAPFSETFGRNPVYISTLILYMIFVTASALSPNFGAQLAFRFLAGLFGSTPLTCAGGSISDLWSPLERVFAFPIFANAAFSGPLLGPIVGGFIAQSTSVTWRWVDWVTLIFSAAVLGLVVLFLPETYPPTLLKWKAEHLRAITGDERYRAAIEIRQESLATRLRRSLYRPFLLTAREPIIMLLALYLTVIYIILFTFLDGYTYIFDDNYGLSQGLGGLCFIGIVVGLCLASILVPFIYKWAKRDLGRIQAEGGSRLPPEFRLWYAMLGGSLAIPVSLFWMGWTARPDISIASPLLASVLFGYGILCIFITCYQYIIDAYESFAASALVSITVIRYIASGGMVVVGVPFYQNLGVPYTLTILACISTPLVPVPFIFYKYGPWIRSKSKYAIKT